MKRSPLLSPFKHNNQPVLSRLAGINEFFLLVFTTEKKLHSGMKEMGYDGPYKIKQVTDINEFLGSIRDQSVRVMLDPHIVNGEKTRWTELAADEEDADRLLSSPNCRTESKKTWLF